MIAKLIVHGRSRDEAINTMTQAHPEFETREVDTLMPFHQRLMRNPGFLAGDYHTRSIEEGLL